MIRKIVEIDRNKCNGCGLCVTACHEGAIQIVDGKATLIHDKYCDGLGNCLPACPTGAITIVEREAADYDEEAVKEKMAKEHMKHDGFVCPGTMARKIQRETKPEARIADNTDNTDNIDNTNNTDNSHNTNNASQKNKAPISSELRQWPVQLKLVNPYADYFENANLLIAADCAAYAYGNFHQDFIKNHITLIGCPKLDDNQYYQEKLTEILKNNNIKSITVVRMEVPCCGGIVNAVKQAMLKSETIVPYREVTIGIDGTIK